MSFTKYYFNYGFNTAMEKHAGDIKNFFTDKGGTDLNTAGKVGVGVTGTGALGLSAYLGHKYGDAIAAKLMEQLSKTANIFTKEDGSLTTGTKLGLGALGLGAAGLGLHSYLKDAPEIAEAAGLAGTPAVLSRGLYGDISDAKDAIISAGSQGSGYLKDKASEIKAAALALSGQAYDKSKELGNTADYFLRGDQDAIDVLRNAR